MIQLTVAMPLYNSRNIAWLALESLCNQVHPGCNWELIVMEEEKNAFGIDNITKYGDRLAEVGCVSIRYFVPEWKIPLSIKWREIAQRAAETSKAFVFCAGDDYYEPEKLKTGLEAINKGYDWVGYRRALLFDIPTKRHIQFDCKGIQPSGNILACPTNSIREVHEEYQERGVDSWLFRSLSPKNPLIIDNEQWKGGFATDGCNTISKDRKNYYSSLKPPFSATELSASKIISKQLYKKLLDAPNN